MQPERLSGLAVARMVKKLAEQAGLDAETYGGHFLRAGHVTSAVIAGASERSIMAQTGHKSVQMVRATSNTAVCFERTARASWLVGYRGGSVLGWRC